jgi:microcystin-dependent protein
MPDFQIAPALTDTYTSVLTTLKDKDTVLAKMDYTSWTNLPTGAIRANSANSYKLERWDGAAWVVLTAQSTIDSHIANTAIHQAPNVGSIQMIAYDVADSGWLLCDGTAVSRTTYATLFAKIGTKYGVGDGTTTFNLPDLKAKLPIGKSTAITALNDLGKTAGSWDHTHTTPAHQHTVASHTHTMGNHTHSVGAHAHPLAAHDHLIPSHYHSATNGDIRILSSGAHSHTENDCRTSDSGTTPLNSIRLTGQSPNASITIDSTSSTHTHANSDFAGRVGDITTGSNGDANFRSFNAVYDDTTTSWLTTENSTAFNTGAPSTNTTDGSGTLTTTAGEGSGTSGAGNPPVLVINYQIKF